MSLLLTPEMAEKLKQHISMLYGECVAQRRSLSDPDAKQSPQTDCRQSLTVLYYIFLLLGCTGDGFLVTVLWSLFGHPWNWWLLLAAGCVSALCTLWVTRHILHHIETLDSGRPRD